MALNELVYKLCTEGQNFGSLATIMPDGSSQVSLLWVDSDGEHIIINTAEGRQKPKNIRRDNRVAISIFDYENPYKQAMVQGTVVEDTHEGAEEHIDKMAKKYMGKDTYPRNEPDEKRVIFKIKPDDVFVWDV